MLIELSKIKPSPKPIRSTWDEQKMKDLSWSLREEGQVEPIGVHENSHGYVIVWGHRRVEAARRAQWTEIEAVVVPQDKPDFTEQEIDNEIRAGIENLASEEMIVKDKANWAQRLVDLGLSHSEISRRSSVPRPTISNWLTGKQEEEAGVIIAPGSSYSQDEGFKKLIEIRGALGDDLEAKKVVAAKVSDDKLTTSQTRSVAEAYRDAPTPEVKAQVLKTPIISRDTAADILRRANFHAQVDQGIKSQDEMGEWAKEREERRMMSEYDLAVKEFLDAMRLFAEVARKGTSVIKYSKYSPEAAQFTIRKIDALIDILKNYKEALEGVK